MGTWAASVILVLIMSIFAVARNDMVAGPLGVLLRYESGKQNKTKNKNKIKSIV